MLEYVNLLECLAAGVGKEMASLEDWYLFRKPKNKPTKYSGKGRPKKTDYAIYTTPWGSEVKELYI